MIAMVSKRIHMKDFKGTLMTTEVTPGRLMEAKLDTPQKYAVLDLQDAGHENFQVLLRVLALAVQPVLLSVFETYHFCPLHMQGR